MITVEKAKQIVLKEVKKLKDVVLIPTVDSLGYSLAEDLFAPLDLPPFPQSNVDGFAVGGWGYQETGWQVIAEVKAGDPKRISLGNGEAVRIFTGAMVPENCTGVIMQEKALQNKEGILFIQDSCQAGEHVRPRAAQIRKGELAVKRNTLISPSVIGFISSLGVDRIPVYRKPSIALIVTGDELQKAGEVLSKGKVYETNSSSLSAAVETMGLAIRKVFWVEDTKTSLTMAFRSAVEDCDVLLISGGISVGDYDFVQEVLAENQTEQLFYTVAQKPGKPLYFGRHECVYVFGLPGNPASAITCFYEYVFPCLRKLQGRKEVFLREQKMPMKQGFSKKKGLAHFLKARASSSGVLALEGQESFKIRSFTESNGFIYLPLEKENVLQGELVEVHLFPLL
jgi:molybdopterin molybdotransferase